MIYLPPSTQPIDPPNSHTRRVLKADLRSLDDNTISDYFKGIRLRHYIETIIAKNESLGVVTGVSIVDLQSQRSLVSHNLDTEQFAASVNKVPVAALILKDLRAGRLTLDQQLAWAEEDVRGGAGVYDQPGAPRQASAKDLLFDMLNPSGNNCCPCFCKSGHGRRSSGQRAL